MRSLWFGLVGGPAAWAVHEMVVAAFAGWACADGTLALGGIPAGGVKAILVGLTLVALAVGLAAMVVASRNWKRVRDGSSGTEARSANVAAFMAVAGLLAGALALVGMIYAVVPLVLVDVCGKLL